MTTLKSPPNIKAYCEAAIVKTMDELNKREHTRKQLPEEYEKKDYYSYFTTHMLFHRLPEEAIQGFTLDTLLRKISYYTGGNNNLFGLEEERIHQYRVFRFKYSEDEVAQEYKTLVYELARRYQQNDFRSPQEKKIASDILNKHSTIKNIKGLDLDSDLPAGWVKELYGFDNTR